MKIQKFQNASAGEWFNRMGSVQKGIDGKYRYYTPEETVLHNSIEDENRAGYFGEVPSIVREKQAAEEARKDSARQEAEWIASQAAKEQAEVENRFNDYDDFNYSENMKILNNIHQKYNTGKPVYFTEEDAEKIRRGAKINELQTYGAKKLGANLTALFAPALGSGLITAPITTLTGMAGGAVTAPIGGYLGYQADKALGGNGAMGSTIGGFLGGVPGAKLGTGIFKRANPVRAVAELINSQYADRGANWKTANKINKAINSNIQSQRFANAEWQFQDPLQIGTSRQTYTALPNTKYLGLPESRFSAAARQTPSLSSIMETIIPPISRNPNEITLSNGQINWPVALRVGANIRAALANEMADWDEGRQGSLDYHNMRHVGRFSKTLARPDRSTLDSMNWDGSLRDHINGILKTIDTMPEGKNFSKRDLREFALFHDLGKSQNRIAGAEVEDLISNILSRMGYRNQGVMNAIAEHNKGGFYGNDLRTATKFADVASGLPWDEQAYRTPQLTRYELADGDHSINTGIDRTEDLLTRVNPVLKDMGLREINPSLPVEEQNKLIQEIVNEYRTFVRGVPNHEDYDTFWDGGWAERDFNNLSQQALEHYGENTPENRARADLEYVPLQKNSHGHRGLFRNGDEMSYNPKGEIDSSFGINPSLEVDGKYVSTSPETANRYGPNNEGHVGVSILSQDPFDAQKESMSNFLLRSLMPIYNTSDTVTNGYIDTPLNRKIMYDWPYRLQTGKALTDQLDINDYDSVYKDALTHNEALNANQYIKNTYSPFYKALGLNVPDFPLIKAGEPLRKYTENPNMTLLEEDELFEKFLEALEDPIKFSTRKDGSIINRFLGSPKEWGFKEAMERILDAYTKNTEPLEVAVNGGKQKAIDVLNKFSVDFPNLVNTLTSIKPDFTRLPRTGYSQAAALMRSQGVKPLYDFPSFRGPLVIDYDAGQKRFIEGNPKEDEDLLYVVGSPNQKLFDSKIFPKGQFINPEDIIVSPARLKNGGILKRK